MSIIKLNSVEDMKKHLKEGSDNIFEFKIMGIYVDVKFNFNFFDTRNKRGEEGGLVTLKARSIKADSIIVDKIEVDKVKAHSVTATYLFAKKVKVDILECMNIETKKLKGKIINTTVLDSEKVKAEYVDACELRNCQKLKAKKVSLLSMNGGRVKAKEVCVNDAQNESNLPSTRKWYNFLLWRDNNQTKERQD